MAGGVSLTTLALFALVSYAQTGTVDVGTILEAVVNAPTAQSQPLDTESPDAIAYRTFASEVLGSTNDAWTQILAAERIRYTPPHFVLFRDATDSACGGAYSDAGPHYCPADQTIYLDETFFDELYERFGGSTGDVAQAYVIAHEVGHHVQEVLGLADESVQQELQADCFAGVWAYSIRDLGIFTPGEIQEALDAAAAVGDDNIQKKSGARVNPDTFTHGSSAQRVGAFKTGFAQGTLAACEQF
ncbi:MAG: hypothetical protein RLZZ342_535 [Candidatus Parcubacteria bacterium]|jgi:predicted metalloprotease